MNIARIMVKPPKVSKCVVERCNWSCEIENDVGSSITAAPRQRGRGRGQSYFWIRPENFVPDYSHVKTSFPEKYSLLENH